MPLLKVINMLFVLFLVTKNTLNGAYKLANSNY